MKHFVRLMCCLLLASCASSNSLKEPSNALKEAISKNTIDIYSQWAEPQFTAAVSQLNAMGLMPAGSVGGRIDIRGNTNYLTIKNDSVMASLPFYGERQMGSNYNSVDQGINFKGIPEDYEIQQEGSAYKVRFKINDTNSRNEQYDVSVLIQSNLNTRITINSSHRFSMGYRGYVAKNTEDKKESLKP